VTDRGCGRGPDPKALLIKPGSKQLLIAVKPKHPLVTSG